MEKYSITLHINSFMTSEYGCETLEELKEYVEEELFQAKHKGKNSITITIKEN